MAPLIRALERDPRFESILVSTGQHRELLEQVWAMFDIWPHHDFNLMTCRQDLTDISVRVIEGMRTALDRCKPDMVLVHGDTSTSFAAALGAYYAKIPVGHVEAGLRTFDKYSPFPEEMNRTLVDQLASVYFAPTKKAVKNLLAAGAPAAQILLTGNTVIDSLFYILAQYAQLASNNRRERPQILLTAHRRENFGAPLERILSAVRDFSRDNPSFDIVYPVHPNPNVRVPAHRLLGDCANVSLIEPLEYHALVQTMAASQFILTDSGGIQEEAPALGKPVIVLRETTERPELIASGSGVLAGTDAAYIRQLMEEWKQPGAAIYDQCDRNRFIFGDGKASEYILEGIATYLEETAGRAAASDVSLPVADTA